MGQVTLNAEAVFALRLTLPLRGRWTAELEVDSEADITGAVTLSDSQPGEQVTFQGAVHRGGVLVNTWRGLIVGGTGGLSKDVTAKHYREIDARTVISELLAEVGEALATTSTATVLAKRLPFWTRLTGGAREALSAVCDAIGATWRVLPSGAVWIGVDTWPAAADQFQVDRDFPAGTVELAPDSINLLPGVTVDGLRVGRVEHCIDDHLRTTVWPVE